ncbi:DUF2201 family putative metallopeptidase [Vreelandella sulfidaeris]
MMTSYDLQSFTPMTPLAQQELAKWQTDRKRWKETLPVMELLSQFLELTPVADKNNTFFASTDGRKLYFCPTFSASLDDEERIFLQAHLIWHCVAGHLSAPLVASPHRWHLACDHEVNSLLLTLGVSLPSRALLFPAYFGRCAIQVYQWLEDHPCINDVTSLDVHPAALWSYSPSRIPDLELVELWRRRAHLTAQRTSDIPTKVAEFCAGR